GTAKGVYKLRVTAKWQTCNKSFCLPLREQTLSVDVAIGGAKMEDAPAATGGSGTTSSAVTTGTPGATSTPGTANILKTTPTAAGVAVAAPAAIIDMAASQQASTLGAYVGLAALMGAL